MENDKRWYTFVLGDIFAQVFQQTKQSGIEGILHASHSTALNIVTFIFILISHWFDSLDRIWVHHILFAFGRDLKKTIIFHIFNNKIVKNSQANDIRPEFGIVFTAFTELFELIMFKLNDRGGLVARNDIYNLVLFKLLFNRLNHLEYEHDLFRGVHFGFRVIAIVAIMAILFSVILTKIV